jgi:radical SAM protein with 4Fe4S-binding SPASM domain
MLRQTETELNFLKNLLLKFEKEKCNNCPLKNKCLTICADFYLDNFSDIIL